MSSYKLTHYAEEDIKCIARYTLKQWGRPQSIRYARRLENYFCQIASGTAHSRSFSGKYPQVKVSHCEYNLDTASVCTYMAQPLDSPGLLKK